ncbi:MAG: ABC transporter substrate-binding protein, partial [Candidatus Rokuibacteriota bacterium]
QVPPAEAGAPTDQLKRHVDEVIGVLDDASTKSQPAKRRAAVRKVAEDIFDYPETARRALGPHWSARTPEEQREFVAIFADLLDHAYLSKIDVYQGEKVQYTGETVDGDQATVKTTLVIPKGTSIPIDYRMHRVNDRWRVYDVVIEGVSLVANYRTQFNRIVRSESYQALVQKLRDRQVQPVASGR